MNLRDLLQQGDNGALIEQIANQLGIDRETARRGVEQLAPAVQRGLQRSTGQSGGLGDLLGQLAAAQGGQPGRTAQPPNGDDVLGQIFGSKDVSRNVAGYASGQSGIDSALLRKMLPLIASAAVMWLSKRGQAGAVAGGPQAGAAAGGTGQGGSLFDMVSGMLDQDGDGSAVDDLLDMARKYF